MFRVVLRKRRVQRRALARFFLTHGRRPFGAYVSKRRLHVSVHRSQRGWNVLWFDRSGTVRAYRSCRFFLGALAHVFEEKQARMSKLNLRVRTD